MDADERAGECIVQAIGTAHSIQRVDEGLSRRLTRDKSPAIVGAALRVADRLGPSAVVSTIATDSGLGRLSTEPCG